MGFNIFRYFHYYYAPSLHNLHWAYDMKQRNTNTLTKNNKTKITKSNTYK